MLFHRYQIVTTDLQLKLETKNWSIYHIYIYIHYIYIYVDDLHLELWIVGDDKSNWIMDCRSMNYWIIMGYE
jgi:hypothetical protein